MNDYIYDHAIILGSDDEPDWYGEVGRLIDEAEKRTPVTRGEIAREDQHMLRQQDQFRKAARLLTKKLSDMPAVKKVVLFGSVALPLWKEVPMHSRLYSRRIKSSMSAEISISLYGSAIRLSPTPFAVLTRL